MNEPLSIRILRPGTFIAVDGSEHSYSEADLAAIGAAYDRESDPSPLVVGHPKLDHPAYGWVASVGVEDGELVAHADPETLEPAFAEAVRKRRFPKVSASFYPPDHKSNPKPGSWYLKHIGFLGAAAPGIKGLGMVSFAESEGLITLETSNQETTMSEQDKTADFAEREADLDRRAGELTTRETALATAELAARHEGSVAFAEVLVEGGKLAPAGKQLVVGIMDDLDGTQAVSFGEDLGELTPLAAFRKLFDGAGKIVAFGEHAAPKGKEGDKQDTSTIARLAAEFAQTERGAGREITIAAAVRHVMKQAED